MQRAFETPQASKVHKSLSFVISGASLRKLLAGGLGGEQLHVSVGFAKFVGSPFLGMPRPDVTYYPVLAVFRLPTGHHFRTFDEYQFESGTTALIYPVYRSRRSSIRAALPDRAIPACRAWLENFQIGSRARKPEGFYALYDQTFDELVYGPNQCAPASRRHALRSTRNENSVISLASYPRGPAVAGR